MNLRKSLNRLERTVPEDDLNITPVMNIFLILIPFLLLTAVFVNIAILEFSLPSSDARARELSQKKNTVLTILAIRENGFELKSQGMKLPAIPKSGNSYAFESLMQRLKEVKARHPETEDIIISPESTIKYDTIIKVMDRCRENGFPNISISA